MLSIQSLSSADKAWVAQFTMEHWGAEIIVAHNTIYHPSTLPGFLAFQDVKKVGLVTYHIAANQCEIVTLNNLHHGQGIGTALVNAVKEVAHQSKWRRLWMITTNDNLNALRFYQKRGFELVTIHRHAVEQARWIKPTIPLIGDGGIPIRDEIELEMMLDDSA
jgi:ribosomal protein S18 acetylase RimI-like enzyme